MLRLNKLADLSAAVGISGAVLAVNLVVVAWVVFYDSSRIEKNRTALFENSGRYTKFVFGRSDLMSVINSESYVGLSFACDGEKFKFFDSDEQGLGVEHLGASSIDFPHRIIRMKAADGKPQCTLLFPKDNRRLGSYIERVFKQCSGRICAFDLPPVVESCTYFRVKMQNDKTWTQGVSNSEAMAILISHETDRQAALRVGDHVNVGTPSVPEIATVQSSRSGKEGVELKIDRQVAANDILARDGWLCKTDRL